MRLILAGPFAVLVAVSAIAGARADCADDINRALPLARALPDPNGRAAVLEEILRARDARHEGDENGCRDQMREVMALLQPKPDPKAPAPQK